ncbi:Fungal Zn binuclear cluster domain containing protein [Cladophialophora carrionii]|uniref:Fungal Zn binuclear cluster domain containing protein n=1 Tax=Cladophialophora carrionii TaxID=86049 RepID=A0A1C1CHC9_9EURO|nr:Fungal Zn binuclear cluster domain containing protein [Cladophialophora carrionii]
MAGNVALAGEDLTYDLDSRSLSYFRSHAWPMQMDQVAAARPDPRRNISPIQTNSHGLRQTTMAEHPMMDTWRFEQQQQQHQQHVHHQHAQHHHAYQHQQQPNVDFTTQQQTYDLPFDPQFHGLPMQPSQMAMMPVSQAPIASGLPLETSYLPLDSGIDGMPQNWADLQSELMTFTTTDVGLAVSPYQQMTSSPTGSHLEVLSQPSSCDEHGWHMVEPRTSFESYERHYFVDPNQTVHNRTLSESSYSDLEPQGHGTFMSSLDVGTSQAVYSPTTLSDSDYEYMGHAHRLSIDQGSAPTMGVNPSALVRPIPIPPAKSTAPSIRSPGSQGSAGSPGRKASKKSPIGVKSTDKVMKKSLPSGKVEGEKRVGRRKGPLRPEQRKQASEIRKLRACLRCKFLKKTCDKGEPCAGCQPSHARLWQVPCTRIDIKEIGYFLKDWKFDYERHISLGFSVGNIKGFSDTEKTLFITHGYGHMLPVTAREVYVRDETCLKMDWIEANSCSPDGFEVGTAKLSAGMEGISTTMLSDYLDRHIDGTGTFDKFVDDYFEGTPFLSQMLKTAYRFYFKTGSKIIKKALKLMLAYNLTLHITMVEGVPSEESFVGRIEEQTSKFFGKTMAPVMINFQIKCAMADMWRELHKDVLEELSSLYSSVYSGDKLKNWPTIFILASVLLAVWECMQFDCHYRVPDAAAVEKFCNDMETTPVGVVVGLFQAISQKLPSFLEWDTSKHHTLLASDMDVCSTMAEVREHVTRYGVFPSFPVNRSVTDGSDRELLTRTT